MVKRPEIEILKPAEQWHNGLINHSFKYGPFAYRVMQSGWQKDDPEETTIKLETDFKECIPTFQDVNRRRWDQNALKYSTTFDGLITPLAAAKIVEVCDTSYDIGYKFGYVDAQRDIKRALGIS